MLNCTEVAPPSGSPGQVHAGILQSGRRVEVLAGCGQHQAHAAIVGDLEGVTFAPEGQTDRDVLADLRAFQTSNDKFWTAGAEAARRSAPMLYLGAVHELSRQPDVLHSTGTQQGLHENLRDSDRDI